VDKSHLVLIGLACIIAAIVGGGLKLAGIEIPLLTSVRRQMLLGALGVVLAGGAGLASLTGNGASEQGPRAQASPGPSVPGAPTCYSQLFQGIAPERVSRLEVGSQGRGVVPEDQPKSDPVGLVFTEDGDPVGALTFRFLPDGGGLFRIGKVVDARCHEVTRISNASRPGGSSRSLTNWDTLRLELDGHSYTARFGAQNDISVNFNREA
jgi:hypothetical protein